MLEDKWKGRHNFSKSMGCNKTVLREATAIQVFSRNKHKSQINNLIYHFKEVDKEQTNLGQQREGTNIYQRGNEQNRVLNRNRIEKTTEIKSWFLKIYKIDKPWPWLTKK